MMNNKKQMGDVKLTQTGMMRQPSRPNRTRRVAEKSATLSRPLHNNHICHRSPVSHVGTKMARVLTNLPCSMSSTQTNPTQALPNTQLSRQSFVANNHEHNTSTCNHSRRNMVCSTKDDSAAQIDVLKSRWRCWSSSSMDAARSWTRHNMGDTTGRCRRKALKSARSVVTKYEADPSELELLPSSEESEDEDELSFVCRPHQ